jgi:hypothetical protein
LGRIVPANLTTAPIPYFVAVDAKYNVTDAYGDQFFVTALGSVSSTTPSFRTVPESADLFLRTTDQCAAGFKLPTYGNLVTNRSVCGTSSYRWKLKEASSLDTVFVNGPAGGSRLLPITLIPNIDPAGGETYQVSIQANSVTGGVSGYGSGKCMKTLPSGLMPTVEDGGVIAERSENGVTTSIYPNPNNGQSVNFAVFGMDGEMNLRIADATGRTVYANRYMIEGSLNTTIDFGQTLAGGVYMVEMIQNGEMKTMRMVVSK